MACGIAGPADLVAANAPVLGALVRGYSLTEPMVPGGGGGEGKKPVTTACSEGR